MADQNSRARSLNYSSYCYFWNVAAPQSDIDFISNDREATVAVLTLIIQDFPQTQLLYNNIGIIGLDLPDSLKQSVSRYKEEGVGCL